MSVHSSSPRPTTPFLATLNTQQEHARALLLHNKHCKCLCERIWCCHTHEAQKIRVRHRTLLSQQPKAVLARIARHRRGLQPKALPPLVLTLVCMHTTPPSTYTTNIVCFHHMLTCICAREKARLVDRVSLLQLARMSRPARAGVACVPRLRLRPSFLRTLLSQQKIGTSTTCTHAGTHAHTPAMTTQLPLSLRFQQGHAAPDDIF